MASPEAAPLTLVDIALDLQIIICVFLHPYDILALRKTCKALQLPTRQRVVWMAALHRVCLDNTLFLPSFPMPDMSDVELEHAAIAPRRWIELYAAFEKQYPNDSGAKLSSRTVRIIEDSPVTVANRPTPDLFIVPGGRYLVTYSPNGIFVWDLGYNSSAECKLIASVGLERESCNCKVHTTSDGMGLIIFSSHSYKDCSVYEIYPQTEVPQLTQIAHLDYDPSTSEDPPAYLLPDRVIWYSFYEDRIVFSVWDYRVNYSISFSADVDAEKFEYNLEVIVTKTAIIVLCEEEVLIWAIPILSPQPPDFFFDHNPIHIPPTFRITFPDGIIRRTDFIGWNTTSGWYFGSSQPLYFDILCRVSKLHRFEIIVKPDLSDASLHIINTSELIPYNFHDVMFGTYSTCEDTLVACWYGIDIDQCGAYAGSTSSRFANVISLAKILLPGTSKNSPNALCPASGRYAYRDRSDICKIVVVDFF